MNFIRKHGPTIALAILSLAKFAIEASQKQGYYDRATEHYYENKENKEKKQKASEQKSKNYKGTINK